MSTSRTTSPGCCCVVMDVTESRHEKPGCQRCLFYTLFSWVTILSLILAVTLTLILTARSPPIQNVVYSQEVTMETENSNVRKAILPWARDEIVTGTEPLSVQRESLVVKKGRDGLYFLYVQVTLQSHDTPEVAPRIWVKQGDRTLLESVLSRRNTNEGLTTGFLGRQVELYAGKHIKVSCSSDSYINTTNTATYLGVYLLKSE